MSRSFITYYSQAGTGASYRKTWRRHLRFLKLRPRFYVEHTKRRLLREIHPSCVPSTIDELKAIDQCLQPTSG